MSSGHIWVGLILPMATLLSVACGEPETASIPASGSRPPLVTPSPGSPAGHTPAKVPHTVGAAHQTATITPFVNVAPRALLNGYKVWNYRPGVVVVDYDRDGDLDLYITAEYGHPNWLYRNNEDGTFTDVAPEAGVTANETNSAGAVACDINNDGFQDLYVGAWGNPRDGLDFRSPSEGSGNIDRLFLNNGNGTFRDITESAFRDEVNLRSATSIACADVDGDGWLDIYVGNLADEDFRNLRKASHPGHYNMLYRNNGDLTFTEISEQTGVRGPEILMRAPDGEPFLFEDPDTGEEYEGYDPTVTDGLGNRVGEPTGQTHAVLFFDYDADGDPDLWVGNDGDRLHVYRNDSSPGNILLTPTAQAMGIDKVGAWMGFAVGDYDGDSDLDVFITNMGYHLRLQPYQGTPGGSCGYHDAFSWGTCLHFLLRNDGTHAVPGTGTIGVFPDVAPSTVVSASPILPPLSVDPSNIHPSHEAPMGLAAYDFGFGTTFFDFDNDGDQDLYWLGSTVARGEAPGGHVFASAGRMLRGDGRGSFEDITVRAHLLDILEVDYPRAPRFNPAARRISNEYHENGKGLAHGDLNGDGYVDLIGTNSSGPIYVNPAEAMEARLTGRQASPAVTSAPGPVFVWLNGGGDNHWISLRLKGRTAVDGTGSNADGIGARVYVKTVPQGAESPLYQVQEVRAGSSYLSMDSTDLEFGVGTATVVEEINVFWPSGRIQVLNDVSVDQVIGITEPP